MAEERKVYKVMMGKPEGKNHSEDQGADGKMRSECILGRLAWGCRLDSTGSGQGPVAGCCECGDEPSVSWATELVWSTSPFRSQYFRKYTLSPNTCSYLCISSLVYRLYTSRSEECAVSIFSIEVSNSEDYNLNSHSPESIKSYKRHEWDRVFVA
jgi:hypothetical protein